MRLNVELSICFIICTSFVVLSLIFITAEKIKEAEQEGKIEEKKAQNWTCVGVTLGVIICLAFYYATFYNGLFVTA